MLPSIVLKTSIENCSPRWSFFVRLFPCPFLTMWYTLTSVGHYTTPHPNVLFTASSSGFHFIKYMSAYSISFWNWCCTPLPWNSQKCVSTFRLVSSSLPNAMTQRCSSSNFPVQIVYCQTCVAVFLYTAVTFEWNFLSPHSLTKTTKSPLGRTLISQTIPRQSSYSLIILIGRLSTSICTDL